MGNFCDVNPIREILRAISNQTDNHHGPINGMICSTLYFTLINKENIEAIFNKADELFLANKEDSGLVLAAMMSSLYDYISGLRSADGTLRFPPQVLIQYHNRHCLMFRVGNLMNKHTPPFSGIMPTSAKYNLDHR